MPIWDTADLLRRCKNLARRPAVDAGVPDAKWYDWLTEAQSEAYVDVFSRFPDFGYGAPFRLLTADGGLTYTFGLDGGGVDNVRPWGHVELYPTLTSVPDSPLTPGVDFIFEGGLIRFPGGRTRSFAGGAPYARFIADPMIPIGVGQDPQMQPKEARMLLVYKALEQWASRRGSGSDPAYWENRYNKWLEKLFLKLSTAYNMQGAQQAGADSTRVWWYSGDLG